MACSAPSCSDSRTSRRSVKFRPGTGPARSRRISAAPHHRHRILSTSRRSTRNWSKPTSSRTSTSRCNSRRPGGGEGHPRQAGRARRWGRQFCQCRGSPKKYRRELGLGMKAGEESHCQGGRTGGDGGMDGSSGARCGDRAHYAGDWLRRAALAKVGIYALDASEAVYPLTRTLPDGELLDGASNRYTLTFAAGNCRQPGLLVTDHVPRPVAAAGRQPDRPIPDQFRHAARLMKNADGSLTSVSQKDRRASRQTATGCQRPMVRSIWYCDFMVRRTAP